MAAVVNQQKINGVIYTPQKIVEKIYDLANLKLCARQSSICDPSCGEGAFLEHAARQICSLDAPSARLKSMLSLLVGFDIDKKALASCRQRLAEIAGSRIKSPVDWSLHCLDATSSPKIGKYFNKFDYVVGNPPYVRIQHLGHRRRCSFADKWQLYSGNSDLFFIFFELGLRLLKPKGTLAYITPNSFISSHAGKNLREFLATQTKLTHLVNYRNLQVFDNATTYSMITVTEKTPPRQTSKISIENARKGLRSEKFKISQTKLTKAPWLLLSESTSRRLATMKKKGVPLHEIAQINVGIQTLADDVFILGAGKQIKQGIKQYIECQSKQGSILIEKGITHPIVKASVMKKGSDMIDRRIIFPYDANAELYSEAFIKRTYPRAYAWLTENKSKLLDRDKGSFDPRLWYAFGRNVSIKSGFGRKILTASMNLSPNFQICNDKDSTFYSGYGIKPLASIKLADFVKELNSQKMAFWINCVSKDYQSGWKSYAKSFIKDYPVSRALLK